MVKDKKQSDINREQDKEHALRAQFMADARKRYGRDTRDSSAICVRTQPLKQKNKIKIVRITVQQAYDIMERCLNSHQRKAFQQRVRLKIRDVRYTQEFRIPEHFLPKLV